MADSRTYDLEPFSSIDIATGIHAVVKTDTIQSVRVETVRPDIYDQLEISVSNGQLHAKRTSDLLNFILNGTLPNMLHFEHDVTIYITVPTLVGIEASSGAMVDADSASGDVVEISASSGSSVTLADIAADKLGLTAASGAKMTLAGVSRMLDLETSSGAHISASGLSCVEARVQGSGGASAKFNASDLVFGHVSSGAHIDLTGKPKSIDVQSSSGGSISTY